jgi:predicted lactoylglutathione lyase
MSTVEKVNIFSDGENNGAVTNYKFLVVLITNDRYTNKEMKKRISLSKQAMENLTKIIKDLEISTNTNVKLLKPSVFPAVLFGCKGKQIRERLIPWTV